MNNGTPNLPQLTIWCQPLEGGRHIELGVGLGPIAAKITLPLEAIDATIQALQGAKTAAQGTRIIRPPPGARIA